MRMKPIQVGLLCLPLMLSYQNCGNEFTVKGTSDLGVHSNSSHSGESHHGDGGTSTTEGSSTSHNHPMTNTKSISRDEYCAAHKNMAGKEHNHQMSHMGDEEKHKEHVSAMGLVIAENASHTAVKCGNWSDPSVWKEGKIPGEKAQIYIPPGIGLTYDIVSNEPFEFIKVDGFMDFATSRNTKMLLDTLVATPSSIVHIGTKENPISNKVKTEIIIIDNGVIDRNLDPEQVSRGIIFHGVSEIHGAKKKSFYTLAAEPMSGDTELKLSAVPTNWNVGDEIVVIGTHFDQGIKRLGSRPSQDEVRKIVAIQGQSLILDESLQFDHDVYPGFDFKAYVALASRNVVIRSENPQGVRGHFMVMHSPMAKIRYAEFRDLGRTDRRKRMDEINIIGRYSLHLHRTGTKDLSKMAIVEGNSVINGPGWGIVHHDSIAAVNHNFVFNVVGAGIVSEAGNEVGEWVGNLVSSVTGKAGDNDRLVFGPANHGVAYFSASRAVIQQKNIAANTNLAWDFEGRLGEVTNMLVGGHGISPRTFKFNANPLQDPARDEDMNQLIGFEGNRAFALYDLIHSTHRMHGEYTNTVNEIRDFEAWRVHGVGLNFRNYTWDYVFRDVVLVGAPGSRKAAASQWVKTEGMSYVNVHFENFGEGISYGLLNFQGKIHNVTFKNVDKPVSSLSDRLKERGVTIPHPETKKPYLPQAVPLDFVSGKITPIEKPILKLDPSNRYVVREGGTVSIKGVVTDSFGSYNLGESKRWTSPQKYSEPAFKSRYWEAKFRDSNFHAPLKDVLPHNGVIKKDGEWMMPVTLWLADRFTGFNHPFTLYFTVEGMDEAFLKEHEIKDYKEPTIDLNLYAEVSDY